MDKTTGRGSLALPHGRVIVAGSRGFTDYEDVGLVYDYLERFRGGGFTCIVSGTAKGVDKIGEMFALENGFEFVPVVIDFLPNFFQINRFGPPKPAPYKTVAGSQMTIIACINGFLSAS